MLHHVEHSGKAHTQISGGRGCASPGGGANVATLHQHIEFTLTEQRCNDLRASRGITGSDLTSSRNRGLSGMKTTPTRAARAGRRHARMNNLQLCI